MAVEPAVIHTQAAKINTAAPISAVSAVSENNQIGVKNGPTLQARVLVLHLNMIPMNYSTERQR